MNLPQFAVRRPITTTMLFLGLVGLGFFSLNRIGQELFPDIALPTVMIYTVSPGVGPYDVESSITKPIEGAVSSLNGLDGVESTSQESISSVTVRFVQGTNMDRALTDIREAVTSVEDEFPEDTQRSRLFLFTAGMLPSLRVNLYTETEGMDLRGIIEDIVLPQLERVSGVARAAIFGGTETAVLIQLDMERLNSVQISIPAIIRAFGGENASLPGGIIRLPERNLTLRTVGTFKTPEDIGQVVIGSNGDAPVYLKDVAEIELTGMPQEEFVFIDGKDGIRLNIQKQPGYNTVTVNKAVLEKLESLRSELPPSLRMEIVEDQAEQVQAAVGGVADSAWQGGLLAILVLLFFLRNIRSTLIIATTIPLSIVATFSLIDFGGMTLNISSLLGITLAVGMFVDNAIVVLESIYRKMLVGFDRKEAAIRGAQEVAGAVTASTLTTLAVFVPMLFVTGLAGILFRDLSLSISFSLIVSLVAALTFIPLLCSKLLRVKPLDKYAHRNGDEISENEIRLAEIDDISLADVDVRTGFKPIDRLAGWIKQGLRNLDDTYERVISWALKHIKTVILSSIGLLVLSGGLIFLMGMEFIPETDDGRFTVNFETKMGATYQETSSKATEIETIIREVVGQHLQSISSRIGDGGSNYGETSVTLVAKDQRPFKIWEAVHKIDAQIKSRVLDLKHTTAIEGMAALATMSSGISSPILIHLSGDDIDKMYEYSTRIKETVSDIPGTRNVRISHTIGKPELVLRVKREEAVSLGLSPLEIAMTIRAAYSGHSVSDFSQNETDYDVRLILEEADRNDIDKIRSIFFMTSKGKKIPLENVVEISDETGPVSISRVDRARVIDVLADLSGTETLNRVSAEVQSAVLALGKPPVGTTLEFTGSSAEMLSSFQSLFIALLVAVALVYMVMAAQFENLTNPLIIMFSIPFAIIGLVLALLLTNTTFNILSFTGAILLAGVVVNNAIVLLDYIKTLQGRGMTLRAAIIHGGKTRLKPILMSTGTTIIGLLPMALGLGAGAELRAPMARAIIGGLTTSTLITLVLIPTILWWIETRLKKRAGTITPPEIPEHKPVKEEKEEILV